MLRSDWIVRIGFVESGSGVGVGRVTVLILTIGVDVGPGVDVVKAERTVVKVASSVEFEPISLNALME